jgi:hypothetical protein
VALALEHPEGRRQRGRAAFRRVARRPWFHRERFGFSFWDPDPDNDDNNAILRAKWTGNLMPSLYCNPAEPDCDPESTGP